MRSQTVCKPTDNAAQHVKKHHKVFLPDFYSLFNNYYIQHTVYAASYIFLLAWSYCGFSVGFLTETCSCHARCATASGGKQLGEFDWQPIRQMRMENNISINYPNLYCFNND